MIHSQHEPLLERTAEDEFVLAMTGACGVAVALTDSSPVRRLSPGISARWGDAEECSATRLDVG